MIYRSLGIASSVGLLDAGIEVTKSTLLGNGCFASILSADAARMSFI
jgi:hypothetical protein